MTRDIEKEAEEYAKQNLVFDEQGNTDELEQINAYLAGAKAERRWWVERWRIITDQIGNCCGRHPFDERALKVSEELDQAAGEVD